jgi:hypothetical protein
VEILNTLTWLAAEFQGAPGSKSCMKSRLDVGREAERTTGSTAASQISPTLPAFPKDAVKIIARRPARNFPPKSL